MTTVTLQDALERISELLTLAEQGETVTIMRDGKALCVIKPAEEPKKGGIDWGAIEAWKRERGIDKIFPYVAPDFDDPLPEDFLITPLPE